MNLFNFYVPLAPQEGPRNESLSRTVHVSFILGLIFLLSFRGFMSFGKIYEFRKRNEFAVQRDKGTSTFLLLSVLLYNLFKNSVLLKLEKNKKRFLRLIFLFLHNFRQFNFIFNGFLYFFLQTFNLLI